MSANGGGGATGGIEMTVEELLQVQNKLASLTEQVERIKKEKKGVELESDHAKKQLETLELKLKAELDGLRLSESRLRMKIEGLEQKNQALVEMVENSALKSQIAAGKTKDFELFKETSIRILREKQDELLFFADKFKDTTSYEKNVSELRIKAIDLEAKSSSLKENLADLKKKEEALLAETPRILADAEVYKSMLAQLAKDKTLLDDISLKRVDMEKGMEKETRLKIFLSTEIEELLHRQRMHEAELEEETRAAAEELLRAKKEVVQRESKYRLNERTNEEVRRRVSKLEEDHEFMKAKIKNVARFSTIHDDRNKNIDANDMKIVTTLEFEKKELRGDLEKLGREKAKLEANLRDLSDKLKIRNQNVLLLASKVSDLFDVDISTIQRSLAHDEKERVNNAVTNKSADDMRLMIEKLAVENAAMVKKLRTLEVRQIMADKD